MKRDKVRSCEAPSLNRLLWLTAHSAKRVTRGVVSLLRVVKLMWHIYIPSHCAGTNSGTLVKTSLFGQPYTVSGLRIVKINRLIFITLQCECLIIYSSAHLHYLFCVSSSPLFHDTCPLGSCFFCWANWFFPSPSPTTSFKRSIR